MKPLRALISFIKLRNKTKADVVLIILIYLKTSYLVKYRPLKKYYHKYFLNVGVEPVNLELYRHEIRNIQKVIMQLPGKQTCLKESIIVHLFFKHKGINIPIHLGVSTKEDFLAHAWYDKNNSLGYEELKEK